MRMIAPTEFMHTLLLACLAMLGASAAAPVSAASIDVWKIQSSEIDPEDYFGITVANGMIGLKSSPHPFQTSSMLMQGVYHRGHENFDVLLPIFNAANLSLAIDGVSIDQASQVAGFRQSLDMKRGALTTTFDYQDKAEVRYTWYALRQLPYTVLVDVTVSARQDISIAPTIAPEAPAMGPEVPKGASPVEYTDRSFKDHNTPAIPLEMLAASTRSPSGDVLQAVSHAFLLDEGADRPKVEHAVDAGGRHALTFTRRIGKGKTYRFTALASVMTSEQTSNPANDVDRLTIFAALVGRDQLLQQHDRAWGELWRSSITVEGDDEAQRDINAMLYHLYAFTREGGAPALSPMGVSGPGYHGHVFWDTETWMFPVLLTLQPEIARSLLEYRYQRLDAARRNAFARGQRGAMFPWESSRSGHEDTPLCCLSGVMQDHITADVGIAAWQYYQVTRDRTWLKERGWPLLQATADFWTSRVERNGPGRYDIRNVVGAAEDQKNVDNEAYTNAAAKENLRAAIEAARVMGVEPNPDWQTVRDNIPILRFPDGTVQANSRYHDQTLTLPEVLFLAYPLREMSDPAEIRRHMALSKVSTQPGLAGSVFMTLSARLGSPDEAYALFRAGHRSLQRPPFEVLAEHTESKDVYFATGAGGLLQAMLFGFGGLEMTDQGLVQGKGALPEKWRSLTLTGIGPEKKTIVIKGGSR